MAVSESVAAGGPEAFGEALTDLGEQLADQADEAAERLRSLTENVGAEQSLSDALLQHKGDKIPPGLTNEQRKRWGKAAELYKAGLSLPKGFQLPDALAEELAELIRDGLSVEEAVDALGELEDYMDGDSEGEDVEEGDR